VNRTLRHPALFALITLIALPQSVIAAPGGGNHSARGSAATSVNHNTNTARNTNVSSSKNTNVNANKNVNVNSNKNVNVHVDSNRGGYDDHGCCYHPVATAAAVTAATVVTAAVVGSMVNTLPPACSSVIVNGIAYQQCGSTWYQPQFSGGNTTYVVINSPR
jgi:hypothetical protein